MNHGIEQWSLTVVIPVGVEFVQVLLYYEIYRKRHANHNGILKF